MVAVIYGSSTLNTEYVAERIVRAFGDDTADLHNVKTADPELIVRRSSLVFVTSTWGTGDLQDDWELFFPRVQGIDMSGKTIGLVGVGDQENYPDTFCDSIRILYDFVISHGGAIVGETSTDGYNFKQSRSVLKGMFVGLVVDEDSQADKSDERISLWVERVRPRLAVSAVNSGSL